MEEIKQLTNYKKGFSFMRTVTFLALILSFGTTGYVYYTSTKKIEELTQQSLYVDVYGDVKEIKRELLTEDIRKLECIDHVIDATLLLNAYDEGTIDDNLDKASFLFGDVFKEILFSFDDQHIKQKLQQNNIYTTVQIEADSVRLDMATGQGTVSFIQEYKKAGIAESNLLSNVVEFKLDTSIPRSNENRHGIKIVEWTLIKSEQIVYEKD